MEYRVVKIEWLDSSTFDGWFDAQMLKELEPYRCNTIGFLMDETDTCYKIVSTIANKDVRHCQAIVIPKGCVLKLT